MRGKIKQFIAFTRELFLFNQTGFALKKYSKLRVASYASFALIFFIFSGIILPYSFKEEITEATSESTHPSTITFVSTNNNAVVTINPTSSGTFASSSDANSIKFSITTDNYTGYQLRARATRSTLNNGSSTISSISSSLTESTFSSSSSYNNRWGYKPNIYSSSANTSYLPSPSTSGVLLDQTTAANSTAKNYTIALGARVDTAIPAGTYINDTLVLEYTANPVPYSITFNNSTDDDIVTGMPNTVSGTAISANNITLPSAVPTRRNYTFAGWCTTIPTATAGGYSCSGTTYAQGADYEINFTASNANNTLYAIWTSNRNCNKAATTIGTGVTATDAVCMQDINDTVITSMTQGTQYTLIDMRDGKSYFIAKQVDGKVWMTQNLDFDLSTSITLTHDNTDLGHTTNTLNQTWTPARSTTSSSVSNWNNNAAVVDSFDPGTIYYYSSGSLDDDVASSTCDDASTCNHYHNGNYYNWRAAVANNITDNTTKYAIMPDSVCPAGWRLIKGPTDDYTFDEDVILYSKIPGHSAYYDEPVKVNFTHSVNSVNMLRSDPIYWNRSGYIKVQELARTGYASTYWHSTVYDEESAFDQWYDKSYYLARDYTNKAYGMTVRCIARMTTGTTTVNFFGNGATSGTMSSKTVDSGDAIRITNEFEKDGHKFVGWNTQADGNGTAYTGRAVSFMPTENITLNLYAQWEEAYIIKYDGNNATGTTIIGYQHEVAENEEVMLYASNYSRTGYGFAGWSTTQIDPDAPNAATLISNAKIFGPNETITVNSSTLGQNFPATITLYAVWVKSAGDMQDWEGCSSMSLGDVTARKDTRDNEVYAIAKLDDGRCWMIENLRLAHNSTDPDWGDASLSQGFSGNFMGLASYEYSSITKTSILPNTLYTTDPTSTTLQYVFGDRAYFYFPRYSNTLASVTPRVTTRGQSFYSYGNYYTWAAAKATTTHHNDNIEGSSICPSGWKLPSRSTIYNNGFGVLNSAMNEGSTTSSLNLRKYPYNFIYAGIIWNATTSDRGAEGFYWSDDTFTHHDGGDGLRITDTVVSVSSSKYKSAAATVRCLTMDGNRITLYANDGSNRKIESETYRYGYTIYEETFYRDGYAITAWNTSSDGSGTSYDIGHSFPADTNIELYAQWTPAYKIIYNGNGASNTDGMASLSHPYAAEGKELTLFSNNYSRTGYGFLGWSQTQINPDASNASTLIANAKIFGPTETITPNQATFGVAAPANITLYAVWLKSSGNLDTWEGCTALTSATYSNGTITPGSIIALTDTRDNNTYAVAKLSDGNCWMIEDLRTDPATANITSSNTNNPSSEFLTNRTNSYSWCTSQDADCVNRVLTFTSTANQYSGKYYNWYTATAGNGTYSWVSGETNGDICPAGWHISAPQRGGMEYTALAASLGSAVNETGENYEPEIAARLRMYPNNFIYGGYYTYSSNLGNPSNMRSNAYYWSSDASSTFTAANRVYIDGNGWSYWRFLANKIDGLKVRCVKKVIRITYDGNGDDNTSTTTVEHVLKSGKTIQLMPSNFKRAGYGFAGWSTTQINPDYSIAPDLLANATVYGPIETISANDFNSDHVTLYAVWIKSAGNLQGWNGCSSMSAGGVTALKDTRDNQVYAVAKLADGNCWMIENLRLDAANSSDSTKAQGFGGVFNGLASSELTSFYNNTLANSLYTTDATSLSLNIISGDLTFVRIPRYNNTNTNNTIATMTKADQNIYSYGNYYNWPAAAANTNVNPASLAQLGTSICPTGWRLPTGGSTSGEFYALNTAANSGSVSSTAALRQYPNNFVYSGYVLSSSIQNRSIYGYYLSGTPSDSDEIYPFKVYQNNAGYEAVYYSTIYRYVGASVRCISASGVEVILDSNDGSDRVARLYGTAGSTLTIPDSQFIVDGYKIVSWNTADDGSGTDLGFSYTIPTGVSSVRIYAQWSAAYSIRYNGNNATSGTDMNNKAHLNVVDGDEVRLFSNNYGRTGYGFLGWSTTQIDPDAANASTLIANAKIFGPNETITISSTTMGQSISNEGVDITLYAVWLKSSGSLQEWTGCGDLTAATFNNDTITPGGVIALTDSRDGNTYAIAKLEDERCWMIENLRLNPSTANITTDNTNEPTATFLSQRTQVFDACSANTADCVERVLFKDNNPESQYAGAYYNWYTATAGNGLLDTTSVINIGDICPAGWHIPSGDTGANREYGSLNVSVGGSRTDLDSTTTPTGGTISKRLRTYPNNFQYNGIFNGSLGSEGYGTGGYTWAANGWNSSSSVHYAHYHGITDELTRLNYGQQKQYLLQVRCIKDTAKVRYDGNGADSGQTMAVAHEAIADSTINLYASNFKRTGYGFLGWSTTQIDPDSNTFTTELANATIYGPNETITLPSAMPDNYILYAVWIKSAGDMQGWTGCSSMSTGDVTARTDTRDNNTYAIAKLGDGKCWMIENLRLSNDYANMDWGDNTKTQGFGGVFNGLANSELATFATGTLANSVYTTNTSSGSNYIIVGDNQQHRVPRYNDTNTTNTVSRMTDSDQNVYSYGNYYSFNAAMANTSEMATATESEYSGTSLCPAGWTLPTNADVGNNKDFETLNTAVNSGSTSSTVGLRQYPNNFILSGYVWNSSIGSRGSTGYYASRTASSVSGYNIFNMESDTSITMAHAAFRTCGSAIRCVAAQGTEIRLDSNNGSGKIARLYAKLENGTIMVGVGLPSKVFEYNGYNLSSWNTSADGSGSSYTSSYTYYSGSATTLYAQWTPAYTITYDGNNATSSTNMNSFIHSGVSDGGSVMLYASNVARTGYGFLGWSTTQIDPDASDAATQIANAKIFGPNETITANSTTLGVSVPATVTLYAVWIKSEGDLQTWDGCGRLTATTYSNGVITPGGVTALTDTRDGTTYAVAKLTDGQCWTIEALRLNPKTANMTINNTDHPAQTFLDNLSTSYSWCSSDTAACAERILFRNPNMAAYSGTYYNWHTATAGSSSYSVNTVAQGSICPAGWHLPTGGTSGTYALLGYSMGGLKANMNASSTPTGGTMSARYRTYPNNFLYLGYTYSSSNDYSYRTWAYYTTSNGWNSGSVYYQYFLGLSDTETRYSYGGRKYNGYLVRCIKGGGTISYNGNGASNSTAMNEATHTEVTPNSEITLNPSNYQRSGYGFLGWSQTQINPDSSTFASDLANATVYGPNETINTTGFSDNVTLYAVWIKSAGNMQGWTGCSSMSNGDVTALKDNRDNQVYAVAKLADGRCWMIENFRLDAASSSDSTKAQGFGGVFEGLANSELTSMTKSSILPNSVYTTDLTSNSLVKIIGDDPEYRFPRYNNSNTANSVASMTSRDENIYSYGNYYTWSAAMANTSRIPSREENTQGTSLCPAGWILPRGNSSEGDFPTMVEAVYPGSTSTQSNLRAYPNNFIYSGYVWEATIYGRGPSGRGNYWASTTDNTGADAAWSLRINSNGYEFSNSYRSVGYSIRCIAATGVEIIYDSNDGTDRIARTYGEAGDTITLPYDKSFFNENYKISSWNTADDGTGTNYTDTYTIPTGVSSVRLYAQWDTPAYTILYKGNGAESTSNMNTVAHSNIEEGENITLKTSNYTRGGNAFLGWSTTQIDPNANNISTLISNAKIFGQNETITVNSTTLGVAAPATVNLYAVWLPYSGTLQSFTFSDCTSLTQTSVSGDVVTPGGIVALRDIRDNETYLVARLSDGNCWITEDLRLDPATASMTASNTNNPTTDFLSNRTNTYSWCSNNNEDCGSRVLSEANTGGVRGGRWYNWYTATAGNGTFEIDNASIGDICPAGWHIPTGGSSGETSALVKSVGATSGSVYSSSTPNGATVSSILRKYPYSFIYNGYKTGAYYYNVGSNGYYTTSTGYEAGDYHYKYYMSISATQINNGSGSGVQDGHAVRCIRNGLMIRYNGNGATGSTSMGITHNVRNGQEVTLAASNYSRSGYGFLGWSTTQINPDSSTFASDLANATVYGPNETITFSGSSDMVLYAVWIKSAGDMQGWTGCSSMSVGDVTARKDTRDNQVYAIAKLADGNCWMIENLRLDATYSSDSTKAQGFGGVFEGLANSETTTFRNEMPNTLYTTDPASQNLNIITGGNLVNRIPRYNSQNTTYTVSSMTTATQNVHSYGNYYNFAASKASTNETNLAGTSICPAGWQLPSEDAATSLISHFNDLIDENSQNVGADRAKLAKKYPNNFIVAGYIASTVTGRGSSGYYYLDKTTMPSSWTAPTLLVSSSNFARTSYSQSDAQSVRCVAASGIEVKLEANDGSSKVMRLYGSAGSTITIPSESFSRPGYAIISWNTNSAGTGTEYTTDYTIPNNATSGISLYAQWVPTYSISYDGNNATGSTSMTIRNENVVENSTAILYASNYSRSGYGFLGWSLTQIDPDASDASTQIANATIYGPNASITANATTLGQSLNGSPKNITFYAVWIKSTGNMQEWSGCTSMTIGSVTARRDVRDGNVYAIARLADGNCWMIENLRLNNNESSSNWGDATLSQGFGGVFNGLANSETTLDNNLLTDNSLYTANGTTSGKISVATDGTSEYGLIPRYRAGSSNAVSVMINSESTVYSYGNYYSYSAANATTKNYTYQSSTANATYDIKNSGVSLCPAGWRLPTSTDKSTLDNNIKESTVIHNTDYTRYPNNFIYSGEVYSNSFYGRGKSGTYWLQSIASSQNYPSIMLFSAGGGASGYYVAKPIRCLVASGVPVILNANDGSGRVARVYGTAGSTITLPTRNIERTGQAINSWNTNASGTGTNYTTSYTIPSGSTGVTLYAVWGSTYSITYNSNNADGGGGMNVTSQIVSAGETVSLYAPNYSRAGYGFLGWSQTQIDPNSSTFATQLANATVYGPNENITAPANSGSTLTLYAVWIKSAGNIQNWTGCSSMSNGDVTALTDLRDDNVYAVAKLADGKCWMIENLRLSNDATNPDWGDSTLSQGFGGMFHGLANSENYNFYATTVSNSLYSIDGTTEYVIWGSDYMARDTSYANNAIPRYSNINTVNTTTVTTKSDPAYAYGNAYNVSAAIANNVLHYNDDPAYSSEYTGTSICPAGWQLPSGGSTSSDFGVLVEAANPSSTYSSTSIGLKKYPNNFVYAGYRSISTGYYVGEQGYYVSRTGNANLYQYRLYLRDNYAPSVTSTGGRTLGTSVRCVLATGVKVTLHSNDGTNRIARIYGTAGSSINLPGGLDEFTRHGYRHLSWNTSADGTGTNYYSTYTIPSGATSVDLYDKWTPAYNITYNSNNATGSTTMNITHKDIAKDWTIPLSASNYSRSGYGFAGWSTTQIDPDSANAATQIANATIYGPHSVFTAPTKTSDTLYLYAVWVKSAGNMQNWSSCLDLSSGGVTALTDTRDGNTYAVSLLADGKCWMIENLRLSHTATINTSNTQGFGGVFTGLPTAETTNFSNSTTANSLYSTSNITGDNIALRFPRYSTLTTVATMTLNSQNVYSYGNYYTWAAAMANTTDMTAATDSEAAGTSICPKGWHLPSGGTDGTKEYYNLSALNELTDFPNNFLLSGYRTGSSLSSRGVYGYYWSRSAATNNAYAIRFDGVNRYSTNQSVKYLGLPVRCIAGS